MLLGWRLLRPELWGAWIGLPLGFADDLIGGAPLGSAMTIWTIVLLGLDLADARIVWRDRTMDATLAGWSLVFSGVAGWAIAWFTGGTGPLWTIALPVLAGLLCFPLAARICAALDRVRLRPLGRR
jgi:rod shape-determining protein MreD